MVHVIIYGGMKPTLESGSARLVPWSDLWGPVLEKTTALGEMLKRKLA